jgi:tRNA U34 2-thiouridine synthase MnmA/TrmU
MSWIAGRPPEGIRRLVSKLFKNNGNNLTNHDNEITAIDSNDNDNHVRNIDSKNKSENNKHLLDRAFRCKYKARYLQPEENCVVTVRLISEKNKNLTKESNITCDSMGTIYNSTKLNESSNYDDINNDEVICNDIINEKNQVESNYGSTKNNYDVNDYELVVSFDAPQRAVTPGQIVALYLGIVRLFCYICLLSVC